MKVLGLFLDSTLSRIHFVQRNASSAVFQLPSNKLHHLQEGPKTETTLTRDEGLKMLTNMHTIRRMETKIGELYKERMVRGYCHLSIGQEAVAAGIESALKPGDTVITSYRCHGFTLMRGASVREIFAELMGRKTGTTKGRGGSMHMYGTGFFGGNGITAAQIPLGAGLAFAHKYKHDNGVNVSLVGDGAFNQGQVFEAFNMAKLLSLPSIFICENNHYGMGTASHRASASLEYYKRGDYMPGVWADGMNILSVREAIRWCAEWCRAGKGPLLLELDLYRFAPHNTNDPETYRTREEVQENRKKRCPIAGLTHLLQESGLATEEEMKKLDKSIKKEVDEILAQARKDPEPDLGEAYTFVSAERLNVPIRGRDCMTWVEPRI